MLCSTLHLLADSSTECLFKSLIQKLQTCTHEPTGAASLLPETQVVEITDAKLQAASESSTYLREPELQMHCQNAFCQPFQDHILVLYKGETHLFIILIPVGPAAAASAPASMNGSGSDGPRAGCSYGWPPH